MGEKDTQSVENVVFELSNDSLALAGKGVSLVKDIGIEVIAIESGNILGVLAEAPQLVDDVKDFIEKGKKIVSEVTDATSLLANSEAIQEIGKDANKLRENIINVYQGKDIVSNLTSAFGKIAELSSHVVGIVNEIYSGLEQNSRLSQDVIAEAKDVINSTRIYKVEPSTIPPSATPALETKTLNKIYSGLEQNSTLSKDVIAKAKNVINSTGIHSVEPSTTPPSATPAPETKTPSYDIKSLAETIGDNMTHADLKPKDLDRSTTHSSAKTADGHYRVG